MADNLANKGPQDRNRINLNEDWERRYWTQALHCSENELKNAVNVVGNSAAEVRLFLDKGQERTGITGGHGGGGK